MIRNKLVIILSTTLISGLSFGFTANLNPNTLPSLPKIASTSNNSVNELTAAEKKAIDAAFNGPRLEEHRIYGHKFNIPKITSASFSGEKFVVRGNLRHFKKYTIDDNIDYKITIHGGSILKDETTIEIDEAWDWRWFLINEIVDWVKGKLDDGDESDEGLLTKDNLDTFDSTLTSIRRAPGDEWQEAGQKLAALIALAAFKKESTVQAADNINLTGKNQFFALGEYSYDELNKVGNNRISSVYVGKGLQVRLCDLEDSGQCRVYKAGQKVNLSSDLNNKTSYLSITKKPKPAPECTSGQTKTMSCAPLNGQKIFTCENGFWRWTSGGCGFGRPSGTSSGF